ncbi:MAG: helix-turn-helix domain-containing protein [Treponema sp.]|jgi:AraC-like DNA-binding protein|nr:helix-turn-helix domain-containing protein [Treponema sp.]
MAQSTEGPADSFLHYPPYSEEDEKLGMLCTTAGSTNVQPRTVYPPRKNEHPALFRTVAEGRVLPEFQLVYITRGEGVFTSGGNTYEVKPGSIMLILPGLKHAYKPLLETGWHEYWVGFKGAYFSTLLAEGRFSPAHVFFETGLQDSLLSIFNQIFDEVRAQRPLYQLKACAGVLSLIAEVLTRERRKDQPNYYQNIVAKAKCLMESNIYGAINLSGISEQLGISTSRLNEIFKTYTSMTPYQYYIHIKIHKAESLLEREDIPVKEAAFRMGFDDQYYFSRLFKSKTGVSPSDWRKFSSRI